MAFRIGDLSGQEVATGLLPDGFCCKKGSPEDSELVAGIVSLGPKRPVKVPWWGAVAGAGEFRARVRLRVRLGCARGRAGSSRDTGQHMRQRGACFPPRLFQFALQLLKVGIEDSLDPLVGLDLGLAEKGKRLRSRGRRRARPQPDGQGQSQRRQACACSHREAPAVPAQRGLGAGRVEFSATDGSGNSLG